MLCIAKSNSEYKKVSPIVNNMPNKSIFFVEEWDDEGYPIKARSINVTKIPDSIFSGGNGYKARYFSRVIEYDINEGVTSIESDLSSYNNYINKFIYPTTLKEAYYYLGGTTIRDGNYYFLEDRSGRYFYLSSLYYTTYKSVTIPESVKIIAQRFLLNNSYITELNLSTTPVCIGSEAFEGCKNLNVINNSDSIKYIGSYAFGSCTSLEPELSLNGIENIKYYCFSSCTSLEKINLENCKSIYGAFSSCSNLKEVVCPKLERLSGAFGSCTSLEKINLENITYFNNSLGNTKFTRLVLPECREFSSAPTQLEVLVAPKLITLGNDAFSSRANITSLDEFDLGLITELPRYCFRSTNIVEITDKHLPNIEVLRYYCFGSCQKLISVDMPNIKKLAGDSVNSGYRNNCDVFFGCENLVTVNLPNCEDNMEVTDDRYKLYEAFYSCSKLESVNIPKIKVIGNNAFYSCRNLKNIVVDSVEKLWSYSLAYCSSLKQIRLPNLKTFWMTAFSSCSNLKFIDLSSTKDIIVMSDSSLSGINSGLMILVPSQYYYSYLTKSNWSAVASKISAIGGNGSIYIHDGVSDYKYKIYNLPNLQINNYEYDNTYFDINNMEIVNNELVVNINPKELCNDISIKLNCSFSDDSEINFTYTIYQSIVDKGIVITPIEGAEYTFVYNESEDYWINNNQNINSSFAICNVRLLGAIGKKIKITYYQSSEYNYDYAIFSQIGRELTLDTNTGGYSQFNTYGKSGTSSYTYPTTLTSNNEFIQVKYRKDSSGHNGTDTFKFRVELVNE